MGCLVRSSVSFLLSTVLARAPRVCATDTSVMEAVTLFLFLSLYTNIGRENNPDIVSDLQQYNAAILQDAYEINV